MSLDELARQHYREQQALAHATTRRAQRTWRQIDKGDIAGSWKTLLELLVRWLSGAQAEAAQRGAIYVTQSVQEAGGVPRPRGIVVPEAFAGIASDGADLTSLLEAPLGPVFERLGEDAPVDDALRAGLNSLTRIVSTQVKDAGRIATSVAMTADEEVAGHVRVVNLPACGRCIILAGRLYRHSTGFLRHPQCDCEMKVVTEDEWDDYEPQDPADLFAQMDEAEQQKAFTKAGARAIRDGADIGQVVNARRGMTTAGGRTFTREGITRRGRAGRRLEGEARRRGRDPRRAARLMPEQIYAEAEALGWDRDETLRQLHRFGYILDLDEARERERRRTEPEAERAAVELAPEPEPAPDPERERELVSEAELAGEQEPEPTRNVPEPEPELPAEASPTVGDFIPGDDHPFDKEAATRFLAEQLDGTYAGLNFRIIQATRPDPDEQSFRATFVITDPDGEPVGSCTRVFSRDAEGDLFVEHESLKIDPDYEGQGVAAEWNGRLEEAIYRPAKFDRIRLFADIDVGGYAWARAGYMWDPAAPEDAEGCLDRLRAERDDLADLLADDDSAAAGARARAQAEHDAASALLDRTRGLTPSDPGFPTPYELSQVGRQDGDAGRHATWIGKRAMLGSEWNGVRAL